MEGEIAKRQTHSSLDVIRFGLALGITWSLGIFCLGILAVFGWGIPIVTLLGSGYIGYSPGLAGAIVGAVWGFVDGFLFGAIIAWLYNWLLRTR